MARSPHCDLRCGLRLLVGVVAVSLGAILARLAGDAPAPAIAAWRLTVSAIVLLPWALRSRHRTISRRTLVWSAASGLALALHFVLWISSLETTSVASSVVFVSTHPIFVAIGSIVVLREAVPRSLRLGVLLAVAGGALIGLGDLRSGGPALHGDLLALGGGLAVSVYFLIGRSLRRDVSLGPYVAISYGTAAVAVLLFCAIIGAPLIGHPPTTYAYLVLLALIPQLLGHSTINWALRRLSASRVSVLVVAEPIGSALLAIPFFHEVPGGLNLIGAAIILAGIYLSFRSEEEHDDTER